MGRSAYLYLLTLGRQCYEPQSQSSSSAAAPAAASSSSAATSNPQLQDGTTQQSDPADPSTSSGAPPAAAAAAEPTPQVSPAQQSIDLQRSLRKAQNDVLTTIGLQLQKGGTGREKSRAERNALQEQENDMGLLLGGIDLAAMYFFTWPLIGVRNELQTFQGLEDIPYTAILRLVIRHRSVFDWFSGVTAHIIYQLVNVLREYAQSLLFKWLKKQKMFRDPLTRKPNRRLLNFLYKGYGLPFQVLPLGE
ncbi:hypothetical protein ABW19_dt0200466 [Dactylella cylindrospora]|nr:hypothetical protein ABW19_dt0200466 [Dactylella cylindrospora]